VLKIEQMRRKSQVVVMTRVNQPAMDIVVFFTNYQKPEPPVTLYPRHSSRYFVTVSSAALSPIKFAQKNYQ
jgi:hypothetical protein